MDKPETKWASERRSARYLFVAPAQITNPATAKVLLAPTGDLSPFGCYIETDKAFPRGTVISITIAHTRQTFTTRGRVIYLTNEGMGIAFDDVEESQHKIVEGWLRLPRNK